MTGQQSKLMRALKMGGDQPPASRPHLAGDDKPEAMAAMTLRCLATNLHIEGRGWKALKVSTLCEVAGAKQSGHMYADANCDLCVRLRADIGKWAEGRR